MENDNLVTDITYEISWKLFTSSFRVMRYRCKYQGKDVRGWAYLSDKLYDSIIDDDNLAHCMIRNFVVSEIG